MISGLKNRSAMLGAYRATGSTYDRSYRINHAQAFLKEDARQLMPHHCNFSGPLVIN